MNGVSRADLQRLFQNTNDPAVLIPALWHASANGQLDGREALALARSPALARAATPKSVAELADLVRERAMRIGEAAFLLTGLIWSHAIAIDDLGSSTLSLPLHEAVR